MKTKIFKTLEEMRPYYNEKINTYNLTGFDLVVFEFDLEIKSDIIANDINALNINTYDIEANNITALDIEANNITALCIRNAWDVKANNINVCNINTYDIEANNITANNILYYAVCIAYENIKCKSVKSKIKNCKYFAPDGKIEILKN